MGSCPDTDIDPGILKHFFKKDTLQISFQYIGPFKNESKEREIKNGHVLAKHRTNWDYKMKFLSKSRKQCKISHAAYPLSLVSAYSAEVSSVRTLAATSHIFILFVKCARHSLSKRARFES